MSMLPESLTANQKQFLRQRYRLDVDNCVRARRLHRFQIMFIWIMPLLAAGLLFVDIPNAPTLYERPAEVVCWALTIFLLAGEALIFGLTVLHVRRTQLAASPPTYYWDAMLRSTIMVRSPAIVLWTHRIGASAIALAALLTNRPELTAAWITACALGLARRSWENRTVKNALAAIDRVPERSEDEPSVTTL